jgi:lipoprotein-anchoring transpeptidase ErfK/SrfK
MVSNRALWIGVTAGGATAAVFAMAAAYEVGASSAAAAPRERSVAVAGETGAGGSLDVPPASSTPIAADPVPVNDPTSAAPASPPPPTRSNTGTASGCPQGKDQLSVETALAQIGGYGPVTIDGVQSNDDCAAIKKLQNRFGIPAEGLAGATTASVAQRIAASRTPAERAKCEPDGRKLTICVDLTQQTAWALRDGAVVWGPTVVRTGMVGYPTPTGAYRIFGRDVQEWSAPYQVTLPYWQAFNDGIAFHETTSPIHDASIGSDGCVNLLHADAVALWDLASIDTAVKVFGRRPGT